MIAIDTNILLRAIVRDNAATSEAAQALLKGLNEEEPGFVCREVLLETAWVLERVYRFTRAQVADALLDLFASGALIPEAGDDVAEAIVAYSRGGADFAGLMILAAAARVGATPLYTFDQKLACEEGAVLLGA